MIDIDLSPAIFNLKTPNTPDMVYFSKTTNNEPYLESYIRLNSLPDDTRRLLVSITEGNNIVNRIRGLMPFFPLGETRNYPSGAVEVSWRFETGEIFSVILTGFKISLEKTEDKGYEIKRSGQISWSFIAPKQPPRSGSFKDLSEFYDFMPKTFSKGTE